MADIYEYLPGFQVTYKDGGLVATKEAATTKSVLVVGTATDGPVGVPLAFTTTESMENLFGKSYDPTTRSAVSGATLVRSAMECYAAGCRDLRVARYGGATASGHLTRSALGSETGAQNAVLIEGYYPGTLYNGVTFKLTKTIGTTSVATNFVVVKPNTKASEWTGGKNMSFPITSYSEGNILNGSSPATAIVNLKALTAGELSAANQIYYKVDTTATKVFLRKGTSGTPVEISYTADTTTLTQLVSAINASTAGAGDGAFVIATLAEGATGTTKVGDAIANVSTYTVLPNGVSADITTIAELIAAVNAHLYNNVVKLSIVTTTESNAATVGALKVSDAMVLVPTATALTGGSNFLAYNSTNLEDIYEQLHCMYQDIGDYQVDSIVVTGVYADDQLTFTMDDASEFTTFGEQLANFCADVNEKNYEMFGIIGAKPPTATTQKAVTTRINELMNVTGDSNLKLQNHYFRYTTTYTKDADTGNYTFSLAEVIDPETGGQKTVGHFINVVTLPELIFSDAILGKYSTNGAASYAGMVSSLSPQSAPTNKVLPNVIGMNYILSPAQLNVLTGQRYVTFRKRNGGAIVCTDGCTAASPLVDGSKSDYCRLSTVRITFAAVGVVRECAEPFIGEPNETAQHNALYTAIESGLKKMKAAGALTGYSFNITASTAQKILGECSIDLVIVPALETRRIRVSVALKASL